MIDLMTAVQRAFFAALDAGVSAQLGGIRDAVPQDAAFPFNKLGAISSTNEGSKDEGPARFEVEVHSLHRGKTRAPLFQQVHAVKQAVMEGELIAEGVVFNDLRWIDDGVSEAASDGVTYAGINIFEVYVEPA